MNSIYLKQGDNMSVGHTKCVNCGKIFFGSSKLCTGCEVEQQRNERVTKRLPRIVKGIAELRTQGGMASDIVMGEHTYEDMKHLIDGRGTLKGRDYFSRRGCTWKGKYMYLDVWLSEGLEVDEMYLFDRREIISTLTR